LTSNARNAIIPLFHHSIIPGWNMQNGGVEISYYQQFVEFPIYKRKGVKDENVFSYCFNHRIFESIGAGPDIG
jgi:hypothetical protein